jgi:HNH endonuclease/AP2 domain
VGNGLPMCQCRFNTNSKENMIMSDITQKLLQELFEYRDGDLYWKVVRKGTKKHKKAGTLNSQGYLQTQINGKIYKNHRLIFIMFNDWQPEQIDHIDQNKLNNKIENLRPATNAENARNTKVRCTSQSGIKNVRWDKRRNKWQVRLKHEGKEKHIGYFNDLKLAEQTAIESRKFYYGEFASSVSC